MEDDRLDGKKLSVVVLCCSVLSHGDGKGNGLTIFTITTSLLVGFCEWVGTGGPGGYRPEAGVSGLLTFQCPLIQKLSRYFYLFLNL